MAGDQDTSELGRAIQDITEKTSLLIREEVELAKAEVSEKMNKLAKGAAIGAAAGVFVIFGLVYLLHSLSWLLWEVIGGDTDYWIGFAIVAAVLFILGTIAGFVSSRLFKRAAPPTPQMAIEEAQLIKETVTGSQSTAVEVRTQPTSPEVRT
jgi:uncharacterized membrane protein YqjE